MWSIQIGERWLWAPANPNIPMDIIKDYIFDNYGVRIKPSGKKQKNQIPNFVQLLEGISINNVIGATPTIPEEILSNLPELLINTIDIYLNPREKDMALIGALTIISGCLPNVSGIYDGKRQYPQLFSFVLAPAAHGKSAFGNARILANEYQKRLKDEYDALLRDYKKGLKTDDDKKEVKEKPVNKVLFIPANCSAAAVIGHLHNSNGIAIFYETEADSMSNTFKNDWGSYSDLLRKAFHNEPISYSRINGEIYWNIELPKLAVGLSGTPEQAIRLFKSIEDGLFSRFIFYCFSAQIKWRDVSPKNTSKPIDEIYNEMAKKIIELVDFCKLNPTEVILNIEQWKILNVKFDEWLRQYSVFVHENTAATIYRLGLICFRICMILTSIRRFENGDISERSVCSDIDFNIAMKLVETFMEHSLAMFRLLPDKAIKISESNLAFYKALPDNEFARKEALAVGIYFSMKDRSVDEKLKILLDNKFLIQSRYGFYAKSANSTNSANSNDNIA